MFWVPDGLLSDHLGRSDRSLLKSLHRHARSRIRRTHVAIHARSSSRVTTHRLRAVSADVTRLTTSVAGLPGRARVAVGGRAVARNVTELAACVALHRLSLAIACEMVGTAAFVAGCGAVGRNTGEATPEPTSRWPASATTCAGCWSWRWGGCSTWIRAVALYEL